MSELSRLRGSERYGACDDEFSVCQAVEWETRSGLPQDRRRSPSDGRSKHYDDETGQAGEGMIERRDLEGDRSMLCLSLLPGEYLTIGEEIVLQYDRTIGERCVVAVSAPREIPIMRGEVFERGGGERPACVFDKPRWYRRELPWDRSKAQALASMRELLSQMDGHDQNVRALRRKLDHIFPRAEP